MAIQNIIHMMKMMNMNEDDISGIISEDQAKSMRWRADLKKQLRFLDKELKPLDKELKKLMKENDIKRIESFDLKITYTPERMYEDFENKSFAIKVIKSIRPDLITKKYGYSRLTITKLKK